MSARTRPRCEVVEEPPDRYAMRCVLAAGHKVPCRFTVDSPMRVGPGLPEEPCPPFEPTLRQSATIWTDDEEQRFRVLARTAHRKDQQSKHCLCCLETVDAIKAAVMAERERCAVLADAMSNELAPTRHVAAVIRGGQGEGT